MRPRALIFLSVLSLTGCLAPGRAYPLYPDAPRKREEVAELNGYVSRVDNQEVAEHGTAFELLPGCHMVGTPAEWGKASAESGGVKVFTGRLIFALPMRAGYQYIIEVKTRILGSGASATVDATERDLHGTTTHVFHPAQTTQDLDDCRNLAASLTP